MGNVKDIKYTRLQALCEKILGNKNNLHERLCTAFPKKHSKPFHLLVRTDTHSSDHPAKSIANTITNLTTSLKNY